MIDDMLSADSLRRRGLSAPKSVANLVADNRARQVDASYTTLSVIYIGYGARCYLINPWGKCAVRVGSQENSARFLKAFGRKRTMAVGTIEDGL